MTTSRQTRSRTPEQPRRAPDAAGSPALADMRLRYPHGTRHPGSHQPGSATGRAQRRHLRPRPGRRRDPARLRRGGGRPRRRSAPRPAPPRPASTGMLANDHPPELIALRPLRQPRRRGPLPPVLALADGAGRRLRAAGRAVGVRRPARARAPRGRLLGLVADRAGARLPDLDDVRRRPALRADDAIAKEWTPLLASTSYDPGLRPVTEKRGALAGMGMTEKQGGSDVRGQRDPGPPDLGGRRVHPARPQVVHLRPDERRVPGARPGRRAASPASCVPRVLPDGTRNRVRRRPAQGQARQPVQRLLRAGVPRHARRSGSATRAAECARSSRWSPRPGSTACWARRR